MEKKMKPAKLFKKSSESSDSADEEDVPRYTVEAMASLPLLPDDCLLGIMKFLGPMDLDNLSKISERLKTLVYDKRLWRRIDFRPNKLVTDELTIFVKYFQKSTKFLAIRGFVDEPFECRQEVLTPQLFQDICTKCPELETLILDGHIGVAFELNLDFFPMSVRHLSMKGCIVTDLDQQRSYFQRMHISLPFIKVLILSDCAWVSPHDFMAISKCYQLEELRMDGCPQLGECVAYTSLAARFGFHSLKILDLRNTRMGDSDVGCFNRSRNLTHLYLECPPHDSEETYGMCGDPTCMDLPFRDNFIDSSDDDEFGMSHLTSANNPANPVFFPPSTYLLNSPSVSPRPSKMMRQECMSNNSLATSSDMRKHNDKGENGNPDLPQASTSHGTLHIIMDPAGPSAVRTARKVVLPKKRPSGDSDSSSDENHSSSQGRSINSSDAEPQESNWSIQKRSLANKQVLNNPDDDDDDDADDDCTSTKPKRQCNEDNSPIKNCKSVPMPVPANSSNIAVAGSSTREQHVRDLDSKSPVQSPSSPASDHENENVNETNNETSEPSDAGGGNTAAADRRWFQHRRPLNEKPVRYPPLPLHCRFKLNGPHSFRLPHHEPSSESTISDMCIMSFVLNDSETDGAGYVRIISPQLVSARPQLHTLVVKNYKLITDATLQYLLKLTSLRHLDVSGTSVTEGGILQFKLKRPEVHVVCDFKNLPV